MIVWAVSDTALRLMIRIELLSRFPQRFPQRFVPSSLFFSSFSFVCVSLCCGFLLPVHAASKNEKSQLCVLGLFLSFAWLLPTCMAASAASIVLFLKFQIGFVRA